MGLDERALTARYLVAVGLVVVLATASYMALRFAIGASSSSEELLAIATEQRVLAGAVAHAAAHTGAQVDVDRDRLARNRTRLADDHDVLRRTSGHVPALRALYGTDDASGPLREAMVAFLAHADAVARPGATPDDVAALHTAFDDLLPQLDDAVAATGAAARATTATIDRVATGAWLVTLVVCAGLVALLFRPMVAEIVADRARLDEARRRTAQIVDTADQAILSLDPDGVIQRANRAAGTLAGLDEVALVGRRLDALLGPWSDDRGLPPPEAGHARRDLLRDDGGRVPVEVVSSRDGDAHIVVLRDLTPWLAALRLEEAYLSTMSHDLRTPLTSVVAGLQLMRSEEAAPRRDELFQLVQRNAVRMLRAIQGLLDLQTLGEAADVLDVAPVTLHDILDEAVRSVAPLAAASRVDVAVDGNAHPTVLGNRTGVEHALVNLLGHAIQHAPPGSTVSVRTRVVPRGRARVEVHDDGPPVADRHLAYAFARMRPPGVPSDGTRDATGLGLAMARQLAERMGGTAGLASSPPRGTTTWVEIPVAHGA